NSTRGSWKSSPAPTAAAGSAPTTPRRSWCAPAPAATPTPSATTSPSSSSTRRGPPPREPRLDPRGGGGTVVSVDPSRLDDAAAAEAADPGGMLRQVASSGAQVREAQRTAAEAGVAALAEDGRPRAVVVAGVGASALAGDVLAAVCGVGCPVPVSTVRGYRLPGWVGAADLVIAVSSSGETEETLEVAAEAARRGCRLLCVGAADSPLASLAERSRGLFVPVRAVGQPRAMLWGLSIPLVVAARTLGLAHVPDAVLESTAAVLEDVAHRCRPSSEPFLNPAKRIALDLAGDVPMVWGSSPPAATAAYRMCSQLNENAGYPGVFGEIPEA